MYNLIQIQMSFSNDFILQIEFWICICKSSHYGCHLRFAFAYFEIHIYISQMNDLSKMTQVIFSLHYVFLWESRVMFKCYNYTKNNLQSNTFSLVI